MYTTHQIEDDGPRSYLDNKEQDELIDSYQKQVPPSLPPSLNQPYLYNEWSSFVNTRCIMHCMHILNVVPTVLRVCIFHTRHFCFGVHLAFIVLVCATSYSVPYAAFPLSIKHPPTL